MKTHEIVALGLLLLVLAGGVFALVESDFRSRQVARPKTEVDWDAVVDDPNEHLTITWLGSRGFVSAREGTWIERRLEERFNIDLKPIFTDSMSYARRRPLMVLAGAVPDALHSPDPHFVQKDVYHGFLLEIPFEVVMKHAPTHVKYVNEIGPNAWLQGSVRGVNYGIPTYSLLGRYPSPGIWRMDWLRKVGITKVPETLDELHEALWRFRHRDPDGNGIKDTYGESPLRNWSRMFEKVFGAHHILPFSWVLHDGEVTWGGLLPDNKKVLVLLKRWYEEELFDPDFMSRQMSFPLTEAIFQSGKVGYLTHRGYYQQMLPVRGSLTYQTLQLQPSAELVPGKVYKGPYGQGITRIWGGAGNTLTFGHQVAARPQIVIRVLRMYEALATDETLHLECRFGKRGEHWEFDQELGIHPLPKYEANRRKHLMAQDITSGSSFYVTNPAWPALADKWSSAGEREYLARHQDRTLAREDLFGKPGALPSAGLYLEKLRDMQMAYFLGVMRGDREISEFDDFVREWKASGGDLLLAEAREMYRIKQEIFRKVGVKSK